MELVDLDHSAHQSAKLSRPIVALSRRYEPHCREPWHSHDHAQFVFAMHGILRVMTPTGMWTLGPNHGLWIAPRIGHELIAMGEVLMHSVYFEPESVPWPEANCRSLVVSSLLREIVAAMVSDKNAGTDRRYAWLTPLMLIELRDAASAFEGNLPLPLDRRLRQICKTLLADPANGGSLTLWGERVGASERTLARLFKEQTGMTFGQWRQHLRVVEAITKLSQGTPVTAIASELGYANASAFITMFRKTMGEPPQRYLKNDVR